MNPSYSFAKSARKIWLVLPFCLIFSLFIANNTYAEVTGAVCKSLVARADVYGEWSPAVTLCAGINDKGKTIIYSLNLSENYYGSKGAVVGGVSKKVELNVGDKDGRGVIFSANDKTGIIEVGGLKSGQARDGGTYDVSQYENNPGGFVDDVLGAGWGVIAADGMTVTKRVGASGGTIISGVECYVDNSTGSTDCDADTLAKYEYAVDSSDYNGSFGDCGWSQQESRKEDYGCVEGYCYSTSYYPLVCGETPGHDVTIYYEMGIVTEDNKVAQTATTGGSSSTAQSGTTQQLEEDCMSSGAAESGGWIVCWIVEWLSDAADGVYKDYVEPALRIEPALFQPQSGSSFSATRGVWANFRDIANVIFVILLLVVIISQITGVGINNYGIKKILPKLVVAAVLINLSYIICMICVDLSNIVGNGVQDLLNGMGGFGDSYTTTVTGKSWNADFTGHLVGAGLLAGLIGGGVAIVLNPAILLSLLVSALSIVISVFFLFILLAAREAAIVVLIVIAPIAVVCYMLPNTKKLFDRWMKIFSALLLLYPICGLLIGGGNFVSKLLMTTMGGTGDGFFAAFVAMIVGVAPIFFIPTVLKSSFAAMGNIGSQIAGLGKQLGGAASGKLRNSSGYKAAQEMGMDRRIRMKAGLNKQGQQTAIGRLKRGAAGAISKAPLIGGLGRGYEKQLARNISQADKGIREQDVASAILAEKETAGWDMDRVAAEWEEAYRSGNGDKLRSLTSVAQRKFGSGAATMIGNIMARAGGTDRYGNQIADNRLVTTDADGNRSVNSNIASSLQTLNDMQSHDSSFNSLMSSKATDAFDMISTMGVYGKDGEGRPVYHNIDDYAGEEGCPGQNATKLSDWNTQSGATLERNVGKMSVDTLEGLAFSETPDLIQGIQSDAGKIVHVYDELARRYSIDTAGMKGADGRYTADGYTQLKTVVRQHWSGRQGNA